MSDIKEVPGVVKMVTGTKLSEPAQVGDLNMAPRTTAEQDISTAGQRKINLIWEVMQALIAASVVGSTLYVSSQLALLSMNPDASEEQSHTAELAFMLFSNLVSLVIGFYFGRTNHTKSGGVKMLDETTR